MQTHHCFLLKLGQVLHVVLILAWSFRLAQQSLHEARAVVAGRRLLRHCGQGGLHTTQIFTKIKGPSQLGDGFNALLNENGEEDDELVG